MKKTPRGNEVWHEVFQKFILGNGSFRFIKFPLEVFRKLFIQSCHVFKNVKRSTSLVAAKVFLHLPILYLSLTSCYLLQMFKVNPLSCE